MNPYEVLSLLAKSRPIFYSEADFQHAFAWMAKSLFMCEPRLEVRMIHTHARASLDLLIRTPEESIGIEFKYVTKPIETVVNGEAFRLLNQGALDILRYDCLKDISRLENAIGSAQINRGFFVILTNDPSLWSPPIRLGNADDEFKIHHSAIVSGTRNWGPTAGPTTRKMRENPLTFSEEYLCEWRPYSFFQGEKFGTFQTLVIEVNSASTSMHSSATQSIQKLQPIEKKLTNSTPVRGANGKYSTLTKFLAELPEDQIELTFDKVAEIVGGLPPTAYNHSAYWSDHQSHPPAVAWSNAGWRQVSLDFQGRKIVLEKITDHPSRSAEHPR